MKIIHSEKLPAGEFVVRYPVLSDAQAMTEYINTLSNERTFIRFQGEHMSVEDETKYLEGLLKSIENKKSVQLLAFIDDTLIGISGIEMKDKTEGHEGVFGISIAEDYRNQGLGKLMMKLVLESAERELPDLKLITLEVFATNEVAIPMYQKFGFVEHGRLPGGVKLADIFVDRILMHKKLV